MTLPVAAAESATVKVAVVVPELPSATLTSLIDKLGVGGGAAVSTSVIVPVAVVRAIVAPLAEDSATEKVSFASATVSRVTLIVTVFEVSPAAKVREPEAAAKSVPLVAVPPLVA